MSLLPSASLWAYTTPILDALNQIKQTAFHYIDVTPATLAEEQVRSAQKDLGLMVSCVALDHSLSGNGSWDSSSSGKTLDFLKRGLDAARSLEANVAAVRSCRQKKQRSGFEDAILTLSEEAAQREIKLCLEHVPGAAFSRASDVIDFIARSGSANLYLLLDVGHTILTKENAWEAIETARDRLGYIQFNDNDGRKDRHWALLDGRLTSGALEKTLSALKTVDYQGALGLDLSSKLPSLISSFSRNRNLLLRLQEETPPFAILEPETRRKH